VKREIKGDPMSGSDRRVKMPNEATVSTRTRISALWAALMFLFVYADVLSLFRPGQIEEISEGLMGPVEATQATLLLAAIIVVIPALMIFLTLTLNARVSRSMNLVLGALYTAVNIGNLIGETWAYYLLFGALEIVLTSLIAWYAWKWPHP
jgi:hypothetical protein